MPSEERIGPVGNSAQGVSSGADLALVNANVLSMDKLGHVWQALIVRDGLIAQLGSDDDILAARGDDVPLVDMERRVVIPGLIDPHQHFSMAVFEPLQVDCRTPPIDRLEEVLRRLHEAAREEPAGRWIRGWGFHWSRTRERRSPSRLDLDTIAPENPVILMDASYHGCFVNSAALESAGIDRHAQPGRAGIIVLDDRGQVEGTLLETAMGRPELLSWASYAMRDPALALELVERLCHRELSLGITSATDALLLPPGATLLRQAAAAGRTPIVVRTLLGGETFFDPPQPERIARSDGFEPEGAMMKVFVDVVHPSPAIDRPIGGQSDAHTGVNYYGRGELTDLVRGAVERGMGVAMHALGNCAIDHALDVIAALRQESEGRNARLRIEHFVLASQQQARRAADLGVAVVTNPGFVDTWGDQYLDRWNIEGRPDLHVLPIRDLLDAGVQTAFASDYPCDDLSPFHGIWSAVARRSWTGEALYPEQAVTPMEALRLATAGAAEASGTDDLEGSLELGKVANMVVLDRDPTACMAEELKSIRVVRTYLHGALEYEDTSMAAPPGD